MTTKKTSTSSKAKKNTSKPAAKKQTEEHSAESTEQSAEEKEEEPKTDETQTTDSAQSVEMEEPKDDQPSQDSEPLEESGAGKLEYLSNVDWGWHKHDFSKWKELLYTEEPAMALEIGAFDGVSACMMADHFFPHPDSKIYTIDPYPERDPSTPQVGPDTEMMFHENVKRGWHEGKVILLKGYSDEVLRDEIEFSELKEKFDFIFIDGAHDAKSVLKDAVLTFDLLKPGGIMIFDDFEWTFVKGELNQPKAGIMAFESVFKDKLELVFSRWARCYRKKE